MHRVELKVLLPYLSSLAGGGWRFLMHRVELKGKDRLIPITANFKKFLMHRVELKGQKEASPCLYKDSTFLMHRVELKASLISILISSKNTVPNAPCGVERIPVLLL